MDQKKIIVVGVVVLAILALFMLVDNKNKLNGGAVSQNILYITQPVNSFSGIVDKIEGNRLTVSQKQTLTQNVMPPVAINISISPSPFPTPKIVTVTYQVTITDKTQIYQPPLNINYLFKTTTLPGAPALPTTTSKLTIKDIKVGQNVTVGSQVDLRTLSGNTFEATMINLPQIANTLNGKIVSLEENTLILKAFAPMTSIANPGNAAPAAPKEKEYRITLTSDTEISRMVYSASAMTPGESPVPPKAEKLALSDLKKDMQATVYTAEDVTESQSLTALRIEPMQTAININPIPPEQIAPISPTPSASASPSIEL